ncbi:hypothetical protein VTN02DRAFT_3979 [Thermoascus thermophilus]
MGERQQDPSGWRGATIHGLLDGDPDQILTSRQPGCLQREPWSFSRTACVPCLRFLLLLLQCPPYTMEARGSRAHGGLTSHRLQLHQAESTNRVRSQRRRSWRDDSSTSTENRCKSTKPQQRPGCTWWLPLHIRSQRLLSVTLGAYQRDIVMISMTNRTCLHSLCYPRAREGCCNLNRSRGRILVDSACRGSPDDCIGKGVACPHLCLVGCLIY